MKKAVVMPILSVVVLGALMIGVALAGSTNFTAHLSGANEVPAVETRGQGQAIFHLDDDELGFKLIATNINDILQAHIHCGTPGVNGPVFVCHVAPPSELFMVFSSAWK